MTFESLLEPLASHASEVADAVFGRPNAPLAALVKEVSHFYTKERDFKPPPNPHQAATRGDLQARARFFLPRDLLKIVGPLQELARCGLLPLDRAWALRDLGAGLGTTSLGVALVARSLGVEEVRCVAIDRDAEALRFFEQLAARLTRAMPERFAKLHLQTHVAELSRAPQSAPADLITFGLSLNELDPPERSQLLSRERDQLREDGAIVAIEPALKRCTRSLHADKDAHEGLRVFAPCLHQRACPMLEEPRDWCHEAVALPLPPPLAEVAQIAGLREERLTYSYVTWRKDGVNLSDFVPKMSSRVVSQPLKSKGKLELALCDGRGLTRVRRMDREASEENAGFAQAPRGAIVVRGHEDARVRKGDAFTLLHAP